MIDLMIAPLRPVKATWNDIANTWREEFPDQLADVPPEGPLLRLLGSDDVVPADVPLAPDLYCRLDLGRPNAIGLSLALSQPLGLSEVDEIEDFGRNLPADEQARIITAWRNVGAVFAVDSSAGRPPGELDLLAGLAIAIATTIDGVIITLDDFGAMETGVGVFTAEQFKTAMWGSDTTDS